MKYPTTPHASLVIVFGAPVDQLADLQPKAIGYVRVSTNRQAENGYGLEAQRDQVEKHCAGNNLDLVGLHIDVMSGKKTTSCMVAMQLCSRDSLVSSVRSWWDGRLGDRTVVDFAGA